MSFLLQCIIHLFLKLQHEFKFFQLTSFAENSYKCIFRYVTQLQDVRPDGINPTTSVLDDKLRKKTKCFPRLLGRNNLRDRWRKCWVVGIDLSNRPDVSGSLDENFKELKDLKQLSLENTKASGDISLLSNNTKLDYLNLHNTSVFGDLAALQKATELQSLNLYNTMVFGDLAALQKAAKLQSLNLYNTTVFGDLAALQRATQLKDFHNFEVSNTKITCPQDVALKAVLVKLGFQEQQLQDLHAMEGLTWMLCSRKSLTFYSLAPYGLAINFYWGRCSKIMRII